MYVCVVCMELVCERSNECACVRACVFLCACVVCVSVCREESDCEVCVYMRNSKGKNTV